jgi:succinyl-CoA synthetase alpha subunit
MDSGLAASRRPGMTGGMMASPFPDAHTPVVVIGGTGRYGSAQIAGMRAAGTNIVSNVAPGRGGSVIDGIAIFDTVADAVAARRASAAVIYTPPAGVRDSIVECAEAGIGFAVVAAEFVPIHDSMLALARARGMWVVGPNSLGFAIPGKILLGSIPTEFTRPGPVALFGRSGTLTSTTARLLKTQGLGQSLVAHIGGDTLSGRNPHEYLQVTADTRRPRSSSIWARSAAARNTRCSTASARSASRSSPWSSAATRCRASAWATPAP